MKRLDNLKKKKCYLEGQRYWLLPASKWWVCVAVNFLTQLKVVRQNWSTLVIFTEIFAKKKNRKSRGKCLCGEQLTKFVSLKTDW